MPLAEIILLEVGNELSGRVELLKRLNLGLSLFSHVLDDPYVLDVGANLYHRAVNPREVASTNEALDEVDSLEVLHVAVLAEGVPTDKHKRLLLLLIVKHVTDRADQRQLSLLLLIPPRQILPQMLQLLIATAGGCVSEVVLLLVLECL
jgi:hypothetical protein